MDYRILGETLPVVEIRLMTGEAMYTQSGGMAWMSEGLTLDSNIKGGLMKGIGRMFTGESLFMATYTAVRPDCIIAFDTSGGYVKDQPYMPERGIPLRPAHG